MASNLGPAILGLQVWQHISQSEERFMVNDKIRFRRSEEDCSVQIHPIAPHALEILAVGPPSKLRQNLYPENVWSEPQK